MPEKVPSKFSLLPSLEMLTWPFATRGARDRTPAPPPQDVPSPTAFAHNDATIKVWLTTELINRLNWISVRTDLSRHDVIRALIFRHLYGELAYEMLNGGDRPQTSDEIVAAARSRAANAAVPAMFPQPVDLEIRRSADRASIHAATIGESTDNMRIKVPQKMKDDLAKLATLEGLPLSHCVRKLLVLAVLGGIRHADWQSALGNIGKDVLKMEADGE